MGDLGERIGKGELERPAEAGRAQLAGTAARLCVPRHMSQPLASPLLRKNALSNTVAWGLCASWRGEGDSRWGSGETYTQTLLLIRNSNDTCRCEGFRSFLVRAQQKQANVSHRLALFYAKAGAWLR